MGAFGCLLSGILIAFLMVLSLGLTLLQKILSLLGIRLPLDKLFHLYMGSNSRYGKDKQSPHQSKPTSSTTSSVTNKKSHYDDNEGEYVDFEEIKD
ncbi:MAG: DUF4834 family protein [Bacteroidales bacterium]|nr:DUF4834 family protein [Candidatus Minthousia equi]